MVEKLTLNTLQSSQHWKGTSATYSFQSQKRGGEPLLSLPTLRITKIYK